MIACYFRFINDDGVPVGYYGIAIARTKRDLFWEIDKYGDPYCVEILTVPSMSFCLYAENAESENEDPEFSRVEFSKVEFNGKWIKPKWPDQAYPIKEAV